MSDTTTAPDSSGVELTKKGERYAARHANKSYFAKISKIRRAAIREIDRLIDLVDRIDGDPDLEEGGDDEPSIGGAYEVDLELDDCDKEPSLGWTTSGQTTWGLSATDDCEEEHDGREDDEREYDVA